MPYAAGGPVKRGPPYAYAPGELGEAVERLPAEAVPAQKVYGS
jgi:hypothetical protein